MLDRGPLSPEAVNALIWAPPVIGPPFFILISILGISAAWAEAPVDSGGCAFMANGMCRGHTARPALTC
ncbi:MAG: hypothetical protein OXN88_02875 [Chloroflexota bacterium]|nr:hypothetical protein [Chloroflexota bacterium]